METTDKIYNIPVNEKIIKMLYYKKLNTREGRNEENEREKAVS